MSEPNLVARISTKDNYEGFKTPVILEAAIKVQNEIMRAAAKCAAITKFGAIPARVLDFELLRGDEGIDKIVLHYENPEHLSGENNYLTKTCSLQYLYDLPNDGSP